MTTSIERFDFHGDVLDVQRDGKLLLPTRRARVLRLVARDPRQAPLPFPTA